MTVPGSPTGPAPAGAYATHQPASAPDDVRAHAAQQVPVGSPRTGPSTGGVVAATFGIVIGVILMLAALAYLFVALGVAAAIAAVLALIPLTLVILGIRWIDRWEPEPRAALVFAFLWGAGASVLIALIVDAEVQNILGAVGTDPASLGAQFFGAAIQAPVVEESAKGLGVLLIALVARKHFDGPVDGIVYAATVASGFAFTENILYFGSTIAESGAFSGDVLFVFFLRAILSPFAHVMFTAMTGIAIGIAARRFGALGIIGLFLVGLIPAMLLHGLWNGATFFVPDLVGYFGYYAVVQVPLFGGMIALVVWLRRQESRLTAERLGDYAAAGWFNPGEISNLTTPSGRSQARVWARAQGVLPIMIGYIRDATRLANARQRIVTGRGRESAQRDEAALLASITAARRTLLTPR